MGHTQHNSTIIIDQVYVEFMEGMVQSGLWR